MEENKFYEICKDLDEVKNYNFSNVDEKEIELQGVDINKCKLTFSEESIPDMNELSSNINDYESYSIRMTKFGLYFVNSCC